MARVKAPGTARRLQSPNRTAELQRQVTGSGKPNRLHRTAAAHLPKKEVARCREVFSSSSAAPRSLTPGFSGCAASRSSPLEATLGRTKQTGDDLAGAEARVRRVAAELAGCRMKTAEHDNGLAPSGCQKANRVHHNLAERRSALT